MTPLAAAAHGRRLVAVALPPGTQVLDALAAALTNPAAPAVLPLAPDVPRRVRRKQLEALRPSALVDAEGTTRLAGGRGVDDEVAVVIATSGSEGAPKGVELTAAALTASARASTARLGASPQDRWLCCLPTAHVGGLLVLVRALVSGPAPVMHPRFDVSEVAGVAAGGEASLVSLVPTMLVRLLDAQVDLRPFRWVLLGGAQAPAALLRRAAAAGARVVTTYGMTETAGGCVYDGVPLDGVEVAVGDDGRVSLRGSVLCHGYRGPGGTVPAVGADGWLRTADLGRLDAEGRLEVLGRADDVVVTGGENVVATRVAALLAEHPGVAEAAVTGRPDPEWGERVVAVIVPADPAAPPSLGDLRTFVAARAAAHEAPRSLMLVERLPLLAGGKLDRGALRAMVAC